MAFLGCLVRNCVFPVRRCSELEIWRGPVGATLQFSKTALYRSGKSAWISGFGGGSGSRPMGNPHVLTPGRASARRLGRHHFGVGTWGLRRRSLRKPRESPCPRGRRLSASRTHPMPLLSCDLSTKSHESMGIGARRDLNAHALVPVRHAMRSAVGGRGGDVRSRRAPNALALMRFEHQSP